MGISSHSRMNIVTQELFSATSTYTNKNTQHKINQNINKFRETTTK